MGPHGSYDGLSHTSYMGSYGVMWVWTLPCYMGLEIITHSLNHILTGIRSLNRKRICASVFWVTLSGKVKRP